MQVTDADTKQKSVITQKIEADSPH